MKFLNPAGLWLLLSVPVLIFLYLIRSHHEDRAVSSTYMWKLSQRFLKRRLPLQKLQRFLLFTLQLLILIAASLMIARPALITGKSTEYIAIIDASASMQTKDSEGVSRFDRAVAQAKELTGQIDHGHRVSVILAGENAQYLIQSSDAAGKVRLALDSAVCENGGCDTGKALTLAQQLCDLGESQVIFYTDSACPQANNVQIVDLNAGEWNLSVDSLATSSSEEGDEYVSAILTSHNRGATVNVGFRMDGTLKTAKRVTLRADAPTEVTFPTSVTDLGSIFEVFVEESDGLALDNSYSLCTDYTRTYNVLLITDSPLYLQSAINSLETCTLAVSNTLDEVTLAGFDLYIFDGIYPRVYPTDGSILQFGTERLPEGLGALDPVALPARMIKSATSHVLYRDLSLYDTSLSTYRPLSSGSGWDTVFSCAGYPVCMTRVNDLNLRQTVFSFDLHHSNLPLQTDFMVLMRNLVEASVFDLIPSAEFSVGDTLELAALPSAGQIHIKLPDGSVKALTPDNGRCSMTLEVTGVHTAVVSTPSGGEYADFYVHIPAEEVLCRDLSPMSVTLTPAGPEAQDAITELWIWLAAALLLLLILEWGVYYREQY